MKFHKGKSAFLIGIIAVYIVVAAGLFYAVNQGIILRSSPGISYSNANDSTIENTVHPIMPQLEDAQNFFNKYFVTNNGHIYLYIANGKNKSYADDGTNSEAISYYMLWTAQSGNKESFDKAVDYVNKYMIHPKFNYMMWALNSSEELIDGGSNIATDADLRAIKALLIAEEKWGDEKYTQLIDRLARGIEKVAITKDGYLAPYGGVSGEDSVWTADEVWLSYSDFTVFKELAKRRGSPWNTIYNNMKNVTLDAQIANGLYNSMLTKERKYGNGIDGGGYSINSMWIMLRNAESKDPQLMQSANKSLQFYKNKFQIDSELYAQYGSNGDPLSPSDTPWVYALVGRAAIALGDREFSTQMIEKLLQHQINDTTEFKGSFPEGEGNDTRIGQFTMQESIITLQDYIYSNGI
jgi:endo-1,4-beta-D-glucanase Y